MLITNRVSPPALGAPKHSLVASGNLVEPGDNRWENGIAFNPRGCYQIDGNCATCPPASKENLQGCVDYVQFGAYVLDLGVSVNSRDDVKTIAQDDLEIGTSSRLESLIWSGCVGVDNPLLSEGTSLGAALAPTLALAAMASELISATGHTGAQGTIHMSPYVATQLTEQVYRENGRLYTVVGDHLVIVGNYPKTHIAGHVGEVDVYLGDPFLSENPDAIRTSNLTAFRVERLALAAWNSCAAFTQQIST
jgi:hypothetical protein